jgi:3-isopropylmalate dehydratase small subunit
MSQASPSNPSRAWVFGDKIDTDVLAPGALMKLSPDALARHCLEAVRPAFAKEVRPGDLVIGGASFGIGSSREQAAQSLRLLGVKAVIAKSFARIFYRNAFNLGLPALICPSRRDFSRPPSRTSLSAPRNCWKSALARLDSSSSASQTGILTQPLIT